MTRAHIVVYGLLACSACKGASVDSATTQAVETPKLSGEVDAQLDPPRAFEAVLVEHVGDAPIDARIRELQARARDSKVLDADLERLGWAFVARARELGDPGSYTMARACALAIEQVSPGNHGGRLLKGHALHSLHHFAEAERIARRLVADRGLSFDYGLLGDVLIDRGSLDAAIEAYQRMVEIRPDAQAYARAAHARYLKGDLHGALEAITLAARAVSPRNRETFAWTWAQLARYQLQQGDTATALDSAERALAVAPLSHHALVEKARALVAAGDLGAALAPLRRASERSQHPTALWLLSEVLEAAGHLADAARVHSLIQLHGEREDPRSLAIYLATHARSLGRAHRLVERELEQRQDIYTYEARAWVQSARGEHAAALMDARRSLAEGTIDPRLLYHAGVIAARAGESAQALSWLRAAEPMAQVLLPSQQQSLHARLAELDTDRPASTDRPAGTKAPDAQQHASRFTTHEGDTQ